MHSSDRVADGSRNGFSRQVNRQEGTPNPETLLWSISSRLTVHSQLSLKPQLCLPHISRGAGRPVLLESYQHPGH